MNNVKDMIKMQRLLYKKHRRTVPSYSKKNKYML